MNANTNNDLYEVAVKEARVECERAVRAADAEYGYDLDMIAKVHSGKAYRDARDAARAHKKWMVDQAYLACAHAMAAARKEYRR